MESVFRTALAHQKAGRLDEAETLYRQARGWKPEWSLGNLGVILRTTGRLDEAEAMLREGLAAAPDNAPMRHTLGMTLLQLGRYAEAWPFYEARREIYPHPHPPLPEWRGEDLRGRRLAVIAEQGLGDQILFSRFLPLVAARASEVVAAVPRTLVRLLEDAPVRAVAPQGWDDVAADCWTFMGSVPRWLEAGPADAPLREAKTVARTGGHGVGLMLNGAARNPNPARIPPPTVGRALRGLATFTDLAPEATGAPDLQATAEIIAGLERVVTVDTSVAHLAGSLGKPTWVLLPRPAVDWYSRWQDDRSDWYPAMRTFRQAAPGDWAGVLRDLSEALADQGSKSKPTAP